MTSSSKNRLAEWFRHWRLPLRRFLSARRGHSSADLDDISQEVFLRLLRYDRVEFVANPQAYLFKIAVNVSTEWSMRPSRRQPHSTDWLETLAYEDNAEMEAERTAREEHLEHALDALSPRAREILRLYYNEGLSYDKISKRLGVSGRIVKRDVARTYMTLRKTLGSGESDQVSRVGRSSRMPPP